MKIVQVNSVYDVGSTGVIAKELNEYALSQGATVYATYAQRSIVSDKNLIKIGNKVNYNDVTEWFKELRDKYNIYVLWTGYDSWGAELWVADMRNNGFTMEEVIQGARTMSSPMKTLACDLAAKKLNYNNNPILKWCLTNTKVEVDKNENIRPIKGKNAKQRIDGAVSLIDAYVILQKHYEDYITMANCV